MAACIAAGIGEPWQMLEGLSAWEGFWWVLFFLVLFLKCKLFYSPQVQGA